jgi:hypothetical protein
MDEFTTIRLNLDEPAPADLFERMAPPWASVARSLSRARLEHRISGLVASGSDDARLKAYRAEARSRDGSPDGE